MKILTPHRQRVLVLVIFLTAVCWVGLSISVLTTLGSTDVTGVTEKANGQMCQQGKWSELIEINGDPVAIAGCSESKKWAKESAEGAASSIDSAIGPTESEIWILFGSMPAAVVGAFAGVSLYRDNHKLLPEHQPGGIRNAVHWFGIFLWVFAVISLGAGLSRVLPSVGVYQDVWEAFGNGFLIALLLWGWAPAALLTGFYAIAQSNGGDD